MSGEPATARPVEIWTDGACSGNPGPGGWGAILRFGDSEKELNGGEPETTNNRMELLAAIMALEALKRPVSVELHTDSQYMRGGITGWIFGWKKNGWKTADKKPVKNVDLWQRLDAATQRHHVRWHWVKGHAGNELNERVDGLARAGMAPFKVEKTGAGTRPPADAGSTQAVQKTPRKAAFGNAMPAGKRED